MNMIPFSFIKYTQPGWQFNLQPKKGASYPSALYHPEYLPLTEIQLELDESYDSKSAQYADIGYRAWNKGQLTLITLEIENQIIAESRPTLKDEYLFINKYWGKHWSVFALVKRLLKLNNPVREIGAWTKASGKKKINVFSQPIDRKEFEGFSSVLIEEKPLVAVIIPTLNRYTYLRDVLHDLENQDYKNFEVIVVDQSTPFDKDFYKEFNLQYEYYSPERGAVVVDCK